jgi:hypothetical protein
MTINPSDYECYFCALDGAHIPADHINNGGLAYCEAHRASLTAPSPLLEGLPLIPADGPHRYEVRTRLPS